MFLCLRGLYWDNPDIDMAILSNRPLLGLLEKHATNLLDARSLTNLSSCGYSGDGSGD